MEVLMKDRCAICDKPLEPDEPVTVTREPVHFLGLPTQSITFTHPGCRSGEVTTVREERRRLGALSPRDEA